MRSFRLKLILFLTPVWLAVLYSIYMGELLPMQVVAWLQAEKYPILYNPKTVYAQPEYLVRLKIDIIERIQPDIMVVGTSRSVGFQAPMFVTNFYNASQTAFSKRGQDSFIRELDPASLPEVILLEMSNFWFDDMEEPVPFDIPTYGEIPFERVFIGGMINTLIITQTSLQELDYAPLKDGWYMIGMNSRYSEFNDFFRRGIRPDGSIYWGTLDDADQLLRRRLPENIEALTSRQMIHFGLHTMNPQEKAYIEDLLAYTSSYGIIVIGYMLPYEPLFYDVMRLSGDYTHFDDIAAELDPLFEHYGGDFVNLIDPGSFDVGTLDFFDAWHMSERMTLQTLIQLAEHEPQILGDHVDVGQLRLQLESVQNPYNLYYSDDSRPLQEFTPLYLPGLPEPQTEEEAMLLLKDRIQQVIGLDNKSDLSFDELMTEN